MAPSEPESLSNAASGSTRHRHAPATIEQSFLTLRGQIDRLIQDFMSDFGPQVGLRTSGHNAFGRIDLEIGGAGQAAPKADFVETPDGFEITVELPGLESDDVEVALIDDAVVVSGNKDEGDMALDAKIHIRERRFGPFRRSFKIPASVDRDALSASFDSGVLTIELPKADQTMKAVPKRIDVQPA